MAPCALVSTFGSSELVRVYAGLYIFSDVLWEDRVGDGVHVVRSVRGLVGNCTFCLLNEVKISQSIG